MKDERRVAWLFRSKLHPGLSCPPSTSLASLGASFAVVCVVVSTILVVNCWWYLALRPQSILLLTSTETGDYGDVNASQTPNLQQHTLSGQCDIFKGEWILDATTPPYTNVTCPYIQPSQNCLMNGRPDRGYLYWKWKPFDCDLAPFNATRFLDLMRGQSLAFVGDSIARNHMQSLQCALTQVEDPLNLYSDPKDKEYKWFFSSYNFTLTNFWAPFLVNFTVENDLYKLHLDIPDRIWSKQLLEYDIAVVSTGYWFHRKSLYYMNNTVLGASPRSGCNVRKVKLLQAMRLVLANVFKYLATNYNGITVLRTVTVDHFEYGTWGNGGLCNRTIPFLNRGEGIPPVPWMNNEINRVEIEEFKKARAYIDDETKFKLLDVTYSAFLRPDGHPGPYRIRQPNEPQNDCLHWCLPGPIDMWNQLVLHILQHT